MPKALLRESTLTMEGFCARIRKEEAFTPGGGRLRVTSEVGPDPRPGGQGRPESLDGAVRGVLARHLSLM